jgi:dienelactone hydrolase
VQSTVMRWISFAALTLSAALGRNPLLAQVSDSRPVVLGVRLGSAALNDSLAAPFWKALASSPCNESEISSDGSGEAGQKMATAHTVRLLRAVAGPSLPPAGAVLEKVQIFKGARYTVDRVLIGSRVNNERAFAYVVRPTLMPRPTPAVVMLHGNGMQPLEAMGWTVATYQPGERAENASFIGAALEFAEAGYTVYLPWLADNSQFSTWRTFPWATLERNGAPLRPRVPGLGPFYFLLNEIAAGLDYLGTLPEVDHQKVAVVGWGDGSQIAVMSAALDPRVRAVVRLSAPIDRHAFRSSVAGLFADARFTHVDCALGDVEMAALVAPRPLLYAYSTKDPTVAKAARFVSISILDRIRGLYAAHPASRGIQVLADTSWSQSDRRHMREWVDSKLDYLPRYVPDTVHSPEIGGRVAADAWIDSTRADRASFSPNLGTCLARSPRPDLTSIPSFLRSVGRFREQVARKLGVPTNQSASIVVLSRVLVAKRSAYSLQLVRFRSARLDLVISGLLAVPDSRPTPREGLPAIVSADGDVDLGTQFGLFGREPVPYLNAYAADLAASGSVVFVPYYPFDFPEIAAVELAARTGGSRGSFSYTIPLLSAAADLLRSLPEVDPNRVGVWGISFGGVAALYAAAIDTRFTSVVFSDPIVTMDVLFATQTSSSLAAWWPEVCSTIDAVQTYLIAPRRFVRENGLRDANGYERTPLETIAQIRSVYTTLGVDSEFVLVRHSGGHETRGSSVKPHLQ